MTDNQRSIAIATVATASSLAYKLYTGKSLSIGSMLVGWGVSYLLDRVMDDAERPCPRI